MNTGHYRNRPFVLSPFLNIGSIKLSFHNHGNIPDNNNLFNSTNKELFNIKWHCLNITGGTPPGPLGLFILRLHSSLKTWNSLKADLVRLMLWLKLKFGIDTLLKSMNKNEKYFFCYMPETIVELRDKRIRTVQVKCIVYFL